MKIKIWYKLIINNTGSMLCDKNPQKKVWSDNNWWVIWGNIVFVAQGAKCSVTLVSCHFPAMLWGYFPSCTGLISWGPPQWGGGGGVLHHTVIFMSDISCLRHRSSAQCRWPVQCRSAPVFLLWYGWKSIIGIILIRYRDLRFKWMQEIMKMVV